MPYARVSAMPQPSGVAGGPSDPYVRGNKPRGITIQDVKKQTAQRLAQEQQRKVTKVTSGASGGGNSSSRSGGFRNRRGKQQNLVNDTESSKKDSSTLTAVVGVGGKGAVVLTDEMIQRNIQAAGANKNNKNMSNVNLQHSDNVSIASMRSVNSSASLQNNEVASVASTTSGNNSSRGGFGFSSYWSRGRSSGSNTNSKNNNRKKVVGKLPHGLTVQELKEMTRARLAAEAAAQQQSLMHPGQSPSPVSLAGNITPMPPPTPHVAPTQHQVWLTAAPDCSPPPPPCSSSGMSNVPAPHHLSPYSSQARAIINSPMPPHMVNVPSVLPPSTMSMGMPSPPPTVMMQTSSPPAVNAYISPWQKSSPGAPDNRSMISPRNGSGYQNHTMVTKTDLNHSLSYGNEIPPQLGNSFLDDLPLEPPPPVIETVNNGRDDDNEMQLPAWIAESVLKTPVSELAHRKTVLPAEELFANNSVFRNEPTVAPTSSASLNNAFSFGSLSHGAIGEGYGRSGTPLAGRQRIESVGSVSIGTGLSSDFGSLLTLNDGLSNGTPTVSSGGFSMYRSPFATKSNQEQEEFGYGVGNDDTQWLS